MISIRLVICRSLIKQQTDDRLEEMYAAIGKNKYLLTRALFRIHELPTIKVYLFEKISGLFHAISKLIDAFSKGEPDGYIRYSLDGVYPVEKD